MAISVVSFSFSRAAQPEARGPTLLGTGFLYRILSPTGLVSKLVSKLTDSLSTPSYIIVQSPTQYLWNGMFDRHQAEITVMQFTGHSLPVHQSMTVHWNFNLSHIVSHPAYAISSHNCHRNVPSVHHFGMACLDGSKVNIQRLCACVYSCVRVKDSACIDVCVYVCLICEYILVCL